MPRRGDHDSLGEDAVQRAYDVNDERLVIEREQSFGASHARALAAGEDHGSGVGDKLISLLTRSVHVRLKPSAEFFLMATAALSVFHRWRHPTVLLARARL